MKNIITRFIKSIGVSVPLKCKVIHGILDVYYYNWVGKDSKYYSMLVAANDTQIFTSKQSLIGNETEVNYDLAANLRIFDTKEDWLLDRWTLDQANNLNKWLEEMLRDFSMISVNFKEYSVYKVCVSMRPVVSISVNYLENDFLKRFTFNLGDRVVLDGTHDFFIFVDKVCTELGIIPSDAYFKLEDINELC